MDFFLFCLLSLLDVDDAACAGGEAGLHELVVLVGFGGVKGAADLVVDEPLPGDGQAENVELVVIDKVRHLAGT